MIEKLPSNITVTFPRSQNHVKGTGFVCPNCGLETGLKAAAESHEIMKALRRTAELRNAWNRLVGQAKEGKMGLVALFDRMADLNVQCRREEVHGKDESSLNP